MSYAVVSGYHLTRDVVPANPPVAPARTPAADNLVPHPRNDEWRHAFRQMADAKIARLEAIMAEAGGRYYDATMERLLDWRARLA